MTSSILFGLLILQLYQLSECLYSVKICELKPCTNSGKCIDASDGTFRCECTELYSGILCEKRVRPCDSQPCKNGGNCSENGVHCFKCECPIGFKGNDCSKKIGVCEGNPCRNSGECIDGKNGTFQCKCTKLYSGILCEQRVRPCDSQPCKNGGNCSDDGVDCFKCKCPSGFKGSDCSEKILPCEASPCKHGGICSNENGMNFKCSCQHGYRGKTCEERDVLALSKILKNNTMYITQLRQWVGNQKKWKLCYRASEHGWRAKDFHSRCDLKGPTLSIISSGEYIFGGYTDVSWGGTAGFKKSTKSFLFSLRNRYNLQPYKADIYQNYDKAIYTYPSYGITFGGGYDIYIQDNADVSSGSTSNFGYTYKPPSGYSYGSTKAHSFFAGSYGFNPSQVEVYYQV